MVRLKGSINDDNCARAACSASSIGSPALPYGYTLAVKDLAPSDSSRTRNVSSGFHTPRIIASLETSRLSIWAFFSSRNCRSAASFFISILRRLATSDFVALTPRPGDGTCFSPLEDRRAASAALLSDVLGLVGFFFFGFSGAP